MKITTLSIAALTAASAFVGAASAQDAAPAPAPAPSPAAPAAKPEPAAAPERTVSPSTKALQTSDQWRTSKIVGLNVYNAKEEKIGDVNDLILGPDGKAEYAVLGVGGFLGIAEKNVAVPFADLKMTRKSDGSLHVLYESTKEALQSAPNYTYFESKRG